MYNNKHWLLCHIRDSFISTDDTGVSEAVLAGEDMPSAFLKNLQKELDEGAAGGAEASSTGGLPVEFCFYPGMDQLDEDDLDLPGSYEVSGGEGDGGIICLLWATTELCVGSSFVRFRVVCHHIIYRYSFMI